LLIIEPPKENFGWMARCGALMKPTKGSEKR
jgi:hypothetical protein